MNEQKISETTKSGYMRIIRALAARLGDQFTPETLRAEVERRGTPYANQTRSALRWWMREHPETAAAIESALAEPPDEYVALAGKFAAESKIKPNVIAALSVASISVHGQNDVWLEYEGRGADLKSVQLSPVAQDALDRITQMAYPTGRASPDDPLVPDLKDPALPLSSFRIRQAKIGYLRRGRQPAPQNADDMIIVHPLHRAAVTAGEIKENKPFAPPPPSSSSASMPGSPQTKHGSTEPAPTFEDFEREAAIIRGAGPPVKTWKQIIADGEAERARAAAEAAAREAAAKDAAP